MASRQICSRREAEKLIAEKKVKVDGEYVDQQGVKFHENVEIEICGTGLANRFVGSTILVHKPVGIVSHLPQGEQMEARQLLNEENLFDPEHVVELDVVLSKREDYAVAGRLDRASRGALIMTIDGVVVKMITAEKCHEKEYLVKVDQPVSHHQIEKLRQMKQLEGQPLLPMLVEKVGLKKMNFKLRQGMKHQIRKVCRAVGLNVLDLFRVRIGPVKLENLAEGQWRPLKRQEMQKLIHPIKESST